MDKNALTHHGIKGMRWGFRRYQNEDGSLTAAGKKRYRADVNDYNHTKEGRKNPKHADLRKETKLDKERMVNEWVDRDNKNAQGFTNEVKNITSTASTALDRSIRRTPKIKERLDLSKKSDQELRNEINREVLEMQYNDLFAPKNSTKGREFVRDLMDGVGTVAGLATSGLIIAKLIRDLK